MAVEELACRIPGNAIISSWDAEQARSDTPLADARTGPWYNEPFPGELSCKMQGSLMLAEGGSGLQETRGWAARKESSDQGQPGQPVGPASFL